jgi:hypothetical protein
MAGIDGNVIGGSIWCRLAPPFNLIEPLRKDDNKQ